MAEVPETKKETKSEEALTKAVSQSPPQLPAVLAGADTLLTGKLRIGVEVRLKSAAGPSALRIADVTGISDGHPVYITKPIKLEGKNLKDFLVAKKILTLEDPPTPERKVKEAYGNFIDALTISCDAFYFTVEPYPLLMMFDLKIEGGLIEKLTDDAALGKLFDITGASVRLLRCEEKDFPTLQKYAAQLAED